MRQTAKNCVRLCRSAKNPAQQEQSSKNKFSSYVLTAIVFASGTLFVQKSNAGLFRFESETLFTDRKDAYLKEQMPILESIQSVYANDNNSANVNTNFSFFADPTQSESNFTLNALSVGLKPIDSVQIQLGRSFNTFFLVRATTTDSVSVSYNPFSSQNITLTAYGGLQRQTEIKDVNIETQLSGGSLHYQSNSMYPFKVQAAYEHLDYKKTLTYENIAKLSASKQFEFFQNIEISANQESDLDTNHLNRFDLGANFYPSAFSNWNVRYLQYELTSVNGWEDPISTVFSQGRIQEASFGFTQSVSPNWLYSFDVGADEYQRQENNTAYGQRGTFDLIYKSDNGVILNNQLMMILSYGGKVWADIFQVQYPMFDKSNLLLNNEFVTYEKITSSKRYAISTQVGVGTWMWNHFKFNLLAEYNRNNFVQDEFKVLGQLLVMEWVEL